MHPQLDILLIGLGNFGLSWATHVLPQCSAARLCAVVDRREERWAMVAPEIPRFHTVEEALKQVRPDLVINATPPDVHTPLNRFLLEQDLPVLCEKPIADSMASAADMAQVLEQTCGFLMIAENYRYHGVFRAVRALLESGRLGQLRRISCHFSHEHPDYSMFYHGRLAHPLLEDVSIHHLDVARYLSGQEPVNVWCREYPAPYCWYGRRPATAHLISDMTGGCVFHYDGTLAAPDSITTWNGHWELQCDLGMVEIRNDRIYLRQGGQTEEIPAEPTQDSRVPMLKEACCALLEGRPGETSFADNLHSFRWMHCAIASAECGAVIPINT